MNKSQDFFRREERERRRIGPEYKKFGFSLSNPQPDEKNNKNSKSPKPLFDSGNELKKRPKNERNEVNPIGMFSGLGTHSEIPQNNFDEIFCEDKKNDEIHDKICKDKKKGSENLSEGVLSDGDANSKNENFFGGEFLGSNANQKNESVLERNLVGVNPQESESKKLDDFFDNVIDIFKKKRKRFYNEVIKNSLEKIFTDYENEFDNFLRSEFKKKFKSSNGSISFIKEKKEENISDKKDDEIPDNAAKKNKKEKDEDKIQDKNDEKNEIMNQDNDINLTEKNELKSNDSSDIQYLMDLIE